MSEVNTGHLNLFNDLALTHKENPKAKGGEELGQKAFLNLMITQLKNQDPLSPQENGEFIAQLAQFSSVESLDRLNNNFDSFSKGFMSNQALQASSLVGRSVSVASQTALLTPDEPVTGLVEVPASTQDLSIEIYGAAGNRIDTVPIGQAAEGDLAFRWNGAQMEVNGKLIKWQSQQTDGIAAGQYKFKAISTQGGKASELKTYLSANVNSVTLEPQGGLTLNLAGIGSVNMSDIRQFNE
jgi:flagellar basal-body rod modification protein FlgD